MHDLTSYQIHQLMQRFPTFELSYETHPHKKVSPDYNVCLAIPVGRKCFAWFTFYGDQNVCFFIELNREKKAGKVSLSSMPVATHLAKGTLLYGTMLDPVINTNECPIFLADDVFYFCGTPTRNLLYGQKLAFLDTFFRTCFEKQHDDVYIAMPLVWPICQQNEYDCAYDIPAQFTKDKLPYTVHHVQYRCLNMSGPFYNVMPSRKITGPTSFGSSASGIRPQQDKWSVGTRPELNSEIRMDIYKSQYKQPTIFVVMADMQFDVYHLFAYGRNKELVYCGVAYIANYKTSVFMNGIFRKIRENGCLDAIEESDDEDDFQDISCDKYVDLEKQVQMECKYNARFKKWEPVRKLDGGHKIVHISQLASHY